MNDARRMMLGIGVAVLLVATALLYMQRPGPESAGGELRWRDWDAGQAEAARTGKPMLVDVFTTWCQFCKRMDQETYPDSTVIAYVNAHFVPVRLDAEQETKAQWLGRVTTRSGLAREWRVEGYPTTVFLRANGEHRVSVPGFLDAKDFLRLLHYVGDGAMDRGVTWDDYTQGEGAR